MNERTSTTYDLGLPNVEVGELIGGGGFARVYRGRDNLLKRDLAIKILRPVLGQNARTAFENEAGIHGPLSRHENIVTIHHAGITTDGAHPYLVMDLVTGGSLGEHLELQRSISWQRAVTWIIPICSAVQHVHESGILHRDIKPDNILLDPPSTPLLSDLGIACLEDDTRPIDAMSFPHVAPEGLRGKRREAPSDVFSIGTTLYQLLSGRAPFGNSAEERVMNLQAIPPRLPTRAAVPLWLEDVLHRALEPDPQLRIQTARDLQAELQAGLDGGVAAPPIHAAPPIDAAISADHPPLGIATPAQRQPVPVVETGSPEPSLPPEQHDWYVPSVQRLLTSDERVRRGRPLVGGLLGIATGVILLVLAVAAIEGVRVSGATDRDVDTTGAPIATSSPPATSSSDSFGDSTTVPPNDTIPPTTELTTTQPPTTATPTTPSPTTVPAEPPTPTVTPPTSPPEPTVGENQCTDRSTTFDAAGDSDQADPCRTETSDTSETTETTDTTEGETTTDTTRTTVEGPVTSADNDG